MMALLQEAEEAGCDRVWAFRGNMRMVSIIFQPLLYQFRLLDDDFILIWVVPAKRCEAGPEGFFLGVQSELPALSYDRAIGSD